MEPDLRILIIDDSQPIREFVVQNLNSKGGYSVREARDGAEGLEMALADPPDLILLDLEMPRLNGFQVVDGLHQHQANIPVILVTSHGSEAIAVEFFRKGVKDYVTKPFTPDELFGAIERAITEIRLRQEKETLTQHLAVANQQLRQRVQELDTLYRVGKSITALLDRDQLLEQIIDAVFQTIEAEEATLLLVDEQKRRLRKQIHRQRTPGQVAQQTFTSVEELAAEAARKGSSIATGAVIAVPLKVGDTVIGVLDVGNRVSGRPFARHELQLLLSMASYATVAIENTRLYEQVSLANQAKSELLSSVIHELGTPVTAIIDPLTQQMENFISTIITNTAHMQVLLSDLRIISRIETGQLRPGTEAVRLAESLENAMQTTRGQIEAQAQQLTLEIPETLPQVKGNPSHLTQILVNLISNACKYTPSGGYIHVQAWPKAGFIHCAVSDTGIGISLEDQEKLFSKFFRSKDPEVQKMPGTGLGLCIVKGLVELCGGQIQIESQPGGTTATFTLPIAPA